MNHGFDHVSDDHYLNSGHTNKILDTLSHQALHYSIKKEPGSPHSPELLSPATAGLNNYQFHFRPPHSGGSGDQQVPSSGQNRSLYRFGSESPIISNSWPSSSSASSTVVNPGVASVSMQHTMSFDEYEDAADELTELPAMPVLSGHSTSVSHEKTIRRRSSKACDQCRKSKCKCERSGDGESCKNCIMMNTPCTFLGPSRKRGPPKGYIDAIEARLHQTEALLGIMIGSNDERARSLLEDLAKDSLAKEIINRVDNSPYGVRGRRRDLDVQQETGGGSKTRGHRQSRSTSPHDENGQPALKTEDRVLDLHSTHPSHEWQDQLAATLRNRGSEPNFSAILSGHNSVSYHRQANSQDSFHRRQRRKTSGEGLSNDFSTYDISSIRDDGRESASTTSTHSDDEDIMDAVGQLSLNEDEEIRYHGKASGLYLLGRRERVDSRNEGGIWRFPPARVWPPLPNDKRYNAYMNGTDVEEHLSKLPDQETQDHLLELYFTYVHPCLPVIHKTTFLEIYKHGLVSCDSPGSPTSANSSNSSSPFNRRRTRIPTVLLLAMFAIAERYSSSHSPPPPQDGSMWAAGDGYLDKAKVILDSTYAVSRPSTVQALLLLGYREVGIGAMAQAWVYIGMAVRMAQDLGMHRSADGWARVGLGGRLFNEWELQERKRIWYASIIMDKYVSTYIGRPLAIFDRDYDTPLASEEEPEELEIWRPHPSKPVGWERNQPAESAPPNPAPGRIISCFNASATLSALVGQIVATIYGIRPISSRHVESVRLETLLDKWYLELPEHLRFEPGSSRFSRAQPHVLTLHMQYWCAVLLLHRPL